eukprot:INCI12563.1.p1 GENE.INCI12563.1~~INCI12563.1.p1  ORF type:complete len:399 (+),score=41.94 INCI12563.1:179-1375(+)
MATMGAGVDAVMASGDNACGSAYHNLSACDFPYSPQSNCTGTYMDLDPELYLFVCGGLLVVATLSLAHLGCRISYLNRLRATKSRTQFPLSLYIMSAIFCVVTSFRSIDAFGYAGTLPFVVVSTLEDVGTAIQVCVFMRIALKWTTVGVVKTASPDARGRQFPPATGGFRKCQCSTPDTLHAIFTLLLLITALVGASLEATIGIPPGAPYGTQNGAVNATKLFIIASVLLTFIVGNAVYGCRVARRLRFMIAHQRREQTPGNNTPGAMSRSRQFENATDGQNSSAPSPHSTRSPAPTGWQSLSQSSIGSTGSDGSNNADLASRSSTPKNTQPVSTGWCGDKRVRRIVIYVVVSNIMGAMGMIYLIYAGVQRLRNCFFFEVLHVCRVQFTACTSVHASF